jgi:hypothetical protein
MNVVALIKKEAHMEHSCSKVSIDNGNTADSSPVLGQINVAVVDVNTVTSEQVAQEFTLKELQSRDNWPYWKKSRWKQLYLYHNQGMF